MSDVSYAVLARAKAKYGKRLKEKDYKSLVECDSVAEVMSYLKNNTRYANAFGEANERDIHRDLFEHLLHQFHTMEIDTISRYDLSTDESFSMYIVKKREINEIIRFLTLLNTKNRFEFYIPPHLQKKAEIDFSKLSMAPNYEEFLNIISKTSYNEIFKNYNLKNSDEIPIAEIEDKLYIKLYKELYDSISHTNSDEFSELHQLFDTILDVENYTRIIRLQKYYNANPKTIKKYLLPFGSFTEKQLNNLCYSDSLNTTYNIIKKTKYSRFLKTFKSQYTSQIISAVTFKTAHHFMYFSHNPTTVMMSYVLLSELEILNLVNIIEGIRYGIEKKNIYELLYY